MLKAQVLAARLAGRPLRAGAALRGDREPAELEGLGAALRRWSTTCSATRKTALKYSLNRYNQARTTGIAANYNPLLSQTATLPWRDVNGDDIAQGDRGCDFGTQPPGCEINFAIVAVELRHRGAERHTAHYPRTWNLEHGARASARAAARPVGDAAAGSMATSTT